MTGLPEGLGVSAADASTILPDFCSSVLTYDDVVGAGFGAGVALDLLLSESGATAALSEIRATAAPIWCCSVRSQGKPCGTSHLRQAN